MLIPYLSPPGNCLILVPYVNPIGSRLTLVPFLAPPDIFTY